MPRLGHAAEVAQPPVLELEPAADVVGHGLGDEDLARVGLARDAGGEVDDPADEVAVVVDRLARVHADAKLQTEAGRRHLLDVTLDVDRAQHGVGRAGELGEEPVSLRADFFAAAGCEARGRGQCPTPR